ncbi:MAG TPA: hypothetical protein VNJ03_01195 [Vicinamibacterales bacterium]|nr:hypothetical protein [Vicinamibacterales bacterium]
MNHLNEEELVLHYYGELDAPASARTEQHLAACAECRHVNTQLQRVMAAVDTIPEPVLPDGFERTVWARLQPDLSGHAGWRTWLSVSPARLAWGSVILLLVSVAFFADRMTQRSNAAAEIAAGAEFREQVLLADLGEHLDRSQTMLVDLVSASDEGAVDVSTERARASELVAANRLYRQTAAATGEARVTELLDQLEQVLVELAASPDTLSADDMDSVRQRIDANGLLFKVRVVSSSVRERQKQKIRTRTGQSS